MSKSWPLIVLALLGAIAAVFCLAAFDWMSWACRLPTSEQGKILAPDLGGCFEFWLNRYQTLIGAILAAGVAIIALKALEYSRQQAFAATKQTNIANYQLHLNRLQTLKRISEEWGGAKNSILFFSIVTARSWTNKEHEEFQAMLLKFANTINDLTRSVYLPHDSSVITATSFLFGFSSLVRDYFATRNIYDKIDMNAPSVEIIKRTQRQLSDYKNFDMLIREEIDSTKRTLFDISNYEFQR